MTESRRDPQQAFARLVDIMAALRAPDGCPWDREQDHHTLKKYLIEEAYELIDSIDAGHDDEIKEELGDVMLQVVFHAQIAREEARFDIAEVLEGISNKLVRRHPHVFGERDAHTAEEVLTNWEADKRKEKKHRQSILDGVPKSLPALMQAQEIQRKVRKVGFDWEKAEEAFDKVEEEWREFREACLANQQAEMEEELGDLLFSIVNISRFSKIDAETALMGTLKKFRRRFAYIEAQLKEEGIELEEASLAQMDAHWEAAKRQEHATQEDNLQ